MKKPATKKECAAYRAHLQCEIGLKVFRDETQPPAGLNRSEYALFLLLHSINDLAMIHLVEEDNQLDKSFP
jgi:hypothetical protein